MIEEKHFIIWGTGYYAGKIIEYLEQMKNEICSFDYSIDAFIDKDENKQKTIFHKVPVHSPDYLNDISKKMTIIISMKDYSETKNHLSEKGFANLVTSSELLCYEKLTTRILEQHPNSILSSDSPFIERNVNRNSIRSSRSFSASIYGLSALMGECIDDLKKASAIADDLVLQRNNKRKNARDVIGIYYSRLHNGGVERVISRLIPLYIDKGHHVVLFTHDINEMDYIIPKSVERCVIPFDPLMPYAWLEEFYRELISRKVDILVNHAHASYRSYYLGLCAKMVGIKYIVESHTCKAAIEKKKSELYMRIYSLADRLVVLSKTDQDYWINKGIDSKYIPNPVCFTDEKCEQNYEEGTVLWVGRIDEEEKRISETIRVFREIKKEIPKVKLKIVGKADSPRILNDFVMMVNKNGLKETIEFCGYSSSVSEYYKRAAVLICTSPYEGFPMSIAESRNYGLPAVVYELEGVELFRDGKGYISVPQGDYKSMAHAIVRVLTDPALRKKLSLEARESIEFFAGIDISELWEEVFEGISNVEHSYSRV